MSSDLSGRLRGFSNPFRYQASRAARIFTTLFAGKQFTDTQGRFYPFGVDANGDVNINSSANHKNSLVFHDTKNGGTDTLLLASGSKIIGFAPNSASDSTLSVLFYKDNGLSHAFFQAFHVSGGTPYSAITGDGSQYVWIGNATVGTIVAYVKQGAPSDSDFPQVVAGMIVWDDTDSKLYVRNIAGTWKSVALA